MKRKLLLPIILFIVLVLAHNVQTRGELSGMQLGVDSNEPFADNFIKQLEDEEEQVTIIKTPEGRLQYTYRVLEDIELRGVNGESKWFFNVDQGMIIRGFRLNLFCRVNELIRTDLSYFTIYMNDIPIKSTSVKEADNQLLNHWIIDIPVDLIREGYNELKIRTYSRITDSPCEDDKNIANWIIIDGNTNYAVLYDSLPGAANIADFPRTFIGMFADDARGTGVVIPHDYSDEEISAALTLIAHMKYQSSGYEFPVTLTTTDALNINSFESLIYIGRSDSAPQGFGSIIEAAYEKNSANIYNAFMENEQKPIFMIVSENGSSLINAVKALKNSDLKAQMIGNFAYVASDLNTQIREEGDNKYIYLIDLGINGIEINGSNRQVANIGLKIAANHVLANEASINLQLRYSDNLDFSKSMISVYVNGIPVGSQRLDRNKRDGDSVTFYLPDRVRRNNYYDVRMVFELIPSGIINCEQYLASVPWVYISDDSNFYFPRQERKLMLFSSLPFPFSKNDDLDATTIVMPDNPTEEDLRAAGKLAALAGTGVRNNLGSIGAVKGSMFTEQYYDNNLIIFGTPENNSAVKAINENLWFKFNNQFTSVLSNEKMELLPETAATAAFMELKPSPFNQEKGMMTIISVDRVMLIRSMEYLQDDRRGYLTGDAAVVNYNGYLQNLRFQKDETGERPIIRTAQELGDNTRDYFIFTGLLILFLITGLVFYMYKYRKKNG